MDAALSIDYANSVSFRNYYFRVVSHDVEMPKLRSASCQKPDTFIWNKYVYLVAMAWKKM